MFQKESFSPEAANLKNAETLEVLKYLKEVFKLQEAKFSAHYGNHKIDQWNKSDQTDRWVRIANLQLLNIGT